MYIKLASYFELQASAPNDSNETSFQKQLQSTLYLQTNLYDKKRGAFFFETTKFSLKMTLLEKNNFCYRISVKE